MNRRPDRVTVTVRDAVGALRKAASDMGPLEMLDEIRYVFHPERTVEVTEGGATFRSYELAEWNRLTGQIRLLKALGFTYCQLTGAVTELSRELRGWRDRKGVTAPDLPACTCRYCS